MPLTRPSYPDLAVRPQIIRNAPLLTFFLSGDPSALRPHIPPPLSPHPDTRIVLNMWFLSDPREMTGFDQPGPMGVSYLAAEVAGEEGASADGAIRFPARFWLAHWSSSPAARRYAHHASGLKIDAGDTRFDLRDGVITATLHLGDRAAIIARARVGHDRLRTISGHSIYYAERAAGAGHREVARLDVPWVSDAYAADDGAVDFDFPQDAVAAGLLANGRQSVSTVTFRKITLTPYIARGRVEPPPRQSVIA